MILATLVHPVQAFVHSLLIGKAQGELLEQLLRQRRAHISDPVGAGMIPGLDHMLVYIVAFKSMVDFGAITHVSIVFFGGYCGLPALSRGKGRPGLLNLPQESSAVGLAALQKQFCARRECQDTHAVVILDRNMSRGRFTCSWRCYAGV